MHCFSHNNGKIQSAVFSPIWTRNKNKREKTVPKKLESCNFSYLHKKIPYNPLCDFRCFPLSCGMLNGRFIICWKFRAQIWFLLFIWLTNMTHHTTIIEFIFDDLLHFDLFTHVPQRDMRQFIHFSFSVKINNFSLTTVFCLRSVNTVVYFHENAVALRNFRWKKAKRKNIIIFILRFVLTWSWKAEIK